MKLASSRENSSQSSLDTQGPESEGSSHSMSPPPFALDASPVQAKGLSSSEGESLSEEGEMQMKSGGSGAMQLKGADSGDGGGGANGGGGGDDLLSNVSSLTGVDVSDTKFHYNSSKPAEVGALAYAQGTDVHLGPGQEKHKGHEAVHVAQQKMGKVSANTSVNGMAVNNEKHLEDEADTLGDQAMQMKSVDQPKQLQTGNAGGDAIQRVEDDNMSLSSDSSYHTANDGFSDTESVSSEDSYYTANDGYSDTESVSSEDSFFTAQDSLSSFDIDSDSELESVSSGPQSEGQGMEEAAGQSLNVTIPGAFDITQGPESFFDYIKAAVGNVATSNTFSVDVAFNINIGIKADILAGMFGIGGGGTFGVNMTLNRQDDRLVRSGWNITYGGQFVSDILWFIHYTHDWVGKSSKTAVFRDVPHCTAVVFDILQEMYNKIAARTDDKLPQFSYDEWDGPGTMNWEALGDRPTTKVTGSTNSHTNTLSLGVDGVNSSASVSKGKHTSESHFYKEVDGETVTKTSTQEVRDASLSLDVDGVGIDLAMAYTDIDNHANSDNDGNYMNLKATFKNFPSLGKVRAGLAADLQGLTSALQGTANPLVSLQLAAGLIAGHVKNQIGSMSAFERMSWQKMKSGASGEAAGSTSNSFSTELNFVKSGDADAGKDVWALQYFRLSAGASVGYEASGEIPVASLYGVATLSVTGGFDAEASASAGVVEVLGSNTLSYIATLYNALVYTEAEVAQGFTTDRFSRWINYRTSHMPAIKKAIVALGDPESVPYYEAVDGMGMDAGGSLASAAAESKATGKVSDQAVQLFENMLWENYQSHKADGTNVAGDTDTMDQAMDDPNNSRTPWYKTVGGSTKIFIDMANQASPVLKRSKYQPKRDSPSQPRTILDALYQEQKVDLEWVVKRRESGSLFKKGGGRVTSEKEFTISKGTSREDAQAKLTKKFKGVLNEPGKFSPELLQANFSETNLPELWDAYYEAKNQEATNRGSRRNKNKDIAAKKSAFIAAIGTAMPVLSKKVLSGVQIAEAGQDVVVNEGFFGNDDQLVVNN